MRRVLSLVLCLLLMMSIVSVGAMAEAKPESITFWMGYSQQSRVDAMEAIGQKYYEQTGVKVNFEVVTWPNTAEKWRAAYSAGQMPDIIICLPDQAVAMFVAGATIPVDDVIEAIGGTEKFLDSVLTEQFYDGSYMAVPHYAHDRLLIYRKDALEAAGQSVPTTPEEYLAVTKAINDPPSYAFQQLFNASDYGSAFMLDIFMRTFGAQYFDESYRIVFDSEETVKAVEFLIDMYEAGSQPDAMDFIINDQFTLLNTGATLMTLDSAFTIKSALDSAPEVAEKMDVALAPANYITTFPVCVCDGENAETAKDFVRFMFEEDNYVDFLASYQPGMNPTMKATAAADSAFWKLPVFENALALKASQTQAEGIEQGGYSIGNQFGANPFSGVLTSGYVEEMFQDIIVNNVPVVDAVKVCAERMQEAVDEQKDALGW
ncbi:extracellular solute-binding protein [Eubacteriales bacterium OttesenSCG-928-N13]|nr:extracellular solute-binding protein [Eubacteriales bacterium OttesenSCG-928-N13]